VISRLKTILDLGLGVVSKKVTKKQENKRKFMVAWEEKYGKDIKGRKPLDFFEEDAGE